jgi:hypothetical protein
MDIAGVGDYGLVQLVLNWLPGIQSQKAFADAFAFLLMASAAGLTAWQSC